MRPERNWCCGKEEVSYDHGLIVVGSGFVGTSAALSFCETAAGEGRSGRAASLETEIGTWDRVRGLGDYVLRLRCSKRRAV